LRKERLPSRRKSEIVARGDGPYKIMQKVGDNAYKIEFSSNINISATLNVGYLTPFIKDEDDGHEDLKGKSSSRKRG